MDTHHSLTFVIERPKRFLIELAGQLLLSFTDLPQITEATSDLVLAAGTPTLVVDGYRPLVFEYVEYVNEAPHVMS